MKAQDKKIEFTKLRAEGRSYSYIADKLAISKSTCCNWEQELKENISTLKTEQLEELYNLYYMTKEARIRELGDTLNNINKALSSAELEKIPPDRLLDYKLKYAEALKAEYIPTSKPALDPEEVREKRIIEVMAETLNEEQAGTITTEQAKKKLDMLNLLLKAYKEQNSYGLDLELDLKQY